MSLNKYMHPRNIYRKPPNFKELAIKYPEFRQGVKVELTGKVKLDFKNPEALRALTSTLLKKDFDLDVEIPLNRLVPTLPLRLNYLLWVEDLIEVLKKDCKNIGSEVRGIDIGTGASCIYPLLAAKKYKWHMLGTDVDSDSITSAQRNVDKNSLNEFITVKQVEGSTLLQGVLDPGVVYDFCMCNPPFFSSKDDLDHTIKSRSPSRHPPNNAPTGTLGEVVIEGGEFAFIKRLMQESKELGTNVRIYTTKVGQKNSLLLLSVELSKLGVTSRAQTEFCQGNTTRWGLAWTFLPGLDLSKAFSVKSGNRKKEKLPMSFCVPRKAVEDYTLDGIAERVVELLNQLQITYKTISTNKHMKTLQIQAATNTWAHQRRKRREKLRQMKEGTQASAGDLAEKESISEADMVPTTSLQTSTPILETNGLYESGESEISQDTFSLSSGKRSLEDSSDEDDAGCNKRMRTMSVVDEAAVIAPVLRATLFIRLLASNIHIELMWLEGCGGKDAMHQVLQYLKNKLR